MNLDHILIKVYASCQYACLDGFKETIFLIKFDEIKSQISE